jgi:thiamine transporter ThiT
MLLGLILSATGIVLLAWAMFRLAVFALPVGLGAATFLWAAGGELGLLLGLLLGLVVGVAALLIGRMFIASRLPVLVRGAVAFLFVVPAGIAGHSVVSGLMHLGGAGPTATGIAAAVGAIIIASAAMMSLLPAMTARTGSHGSPLHG